MCAGHFYLATSFLAMKEASQSSLHVEKCLEIRKPIFPVGHSNIGKCEKYFIQLFLLLFCTILLLLPSVSNIEIEKEEQGRISSCSQKCFQNLHTPLIETREICSVTLFY